MPVATSQSPGTLAEITKPKLLPMKKILTIFSLFIVSNHFSQLNTTSITFDNYVSETDNDLKNNFVSTPYYNKLIKNDNNYYVETPLQGTPTQPLTFCKKYQGIDSETMKISLDYKKDEYPTPTSNSVAVGIFVADDSNITVLSASMGNNLEFFIGGLSNPNNPYSSFVNHNNYPNLNWYRLTLEITKTAVSKFLLTSKIYRLGPDGNSNPTLIFTKSTEGFNYQFKPTSNFRINLVGGYWEDVRYLDNFSIYGFENGSACDNLSVNNFSALSQNIFPNPVENILNIKQNSSKIEVMSLEGKIIKTYLNPNNKINLENLKKGVYLINIYTKEGIIMKKIIKK